jgi:hypothetical protein
MQVYRPPVCPQRFRTAPVHPDMQMVAGFGQPKIPMAMVSGRQDGSAAAIWRGHSPVTGESRLALLGRRSSGGVHFDNVAALGFRRSSGGVHFDNVAALGFQVLKRRCRGR